MQHRTDVSEKDDRKLSFREQNLFAKVRDDLFGGGEGYFKFQDFLLDNPRFGDVVPGTAGARKIRWVDPGRGKGKRGGIRVYYYYAEEFDTILFIAGYDKNVPDLNADEKKIVAQVIRLFQQQLQDERLPKHEAGKPTDK